MGSHFQKKYEDFYYLASINCSLKLAPEDLFDCALVVIEFMKSLELLKILVKNSSGFGGWLLKVIISVKISRFCTEGLIIFSNVKLSLIQHAKLMLFGINLGQKAETKFKIINDEFKT